MVVLSAGKQHIFRAAGVGGLDSFYIAGGGSEMKRRRQAWSVTWLFLVDSWGKLQRVDVVADWVVLCQICRIFICFVLGVVDVR